MKEMHKHWKNIFLRGLIAFIFGLVALFWPGIGFEFLVYFFAFYSLIDGIIALLVGIKTKSVGFILEGIVGLLVGIFILVNTAAAISIFLFLVALWAIITGVFEIVSAIELKNHPVDEVWLFVVGIISILFGILVFINPVLTALAITLIIGVYAIVFGMFLMALAFTLKGNKPSKSKKK